MNDHDTQEDRRESKLHALRATATPADRIKIAEITAATREAAARNFGGRVSELMVDRLVDNILLTEQAAVSIKSSHNQMPETHSGWDRVVKQAAESDSWVKANLISSDSKLREEMRAECMATLAPNKAIHLYRTGDLDGFVKNWIDSRIQEQMDAIR